MPKATENTTRLPDFSRAVDKRPHVPISKETIGEVQRRLEESKSAKPTPAPI